MINNYVIFDANGLLSDSELHPISKGNNLADKFHVAFTEYDYNTTYITVAVTLPDGNTLPELSTAISDFTFKGDNYRGYSFLFTEALTSIAGVLTLTFYLKSKEDDTRLCTSRLNVTIHDSDVATEPTITEAQMQNLLSTLDNTAKEIDTKKLDKDFTPYERDKNIQGHELIAVFDAFDWKTKTITVEDTRNINKVNGVAPYEKEINLFASDIPYGDKNVASAIEETKIELLNKANVADVVGHREGLIIQGDVETTPYKGLIPYLYTEPTYGTETTEATIKTNGIEFKVGDLINLDLSLYSGTSKGTITINKIITNTFKEEEVYIVPVVTRDANNLSPSGFVQTCSYSIKITNEKIIIKGRRFFESENTYTDYPFVELKNIAIFRA